MDNLEAFTRNGFEFAIDDEAEPTKRVALKTQPVSKNWTFGRDGMHDVHVLLRKIMGCSFNLILFSFR